MVEMQHLQELQVVEGGATESHQHPMRNVKNTQVWKRREREGLQDWMVDIQ